jgi:hypothetical protein
LGVNEKDPELLEIAGALKYPHVGRSIDVYREQLTNRLLALFGGTVLIDVIMAGIATFTGHDFSAAREVIRDVIPAETGLLGAAIGYYFGARGR